MSRLAWMGLVLALTACGGGGGGGAAGGGNADPGPVAVDRSGQAYWTNFNDNQVSFFRLGADGLKSSAATVSATGSGGPVALALSPNGSFLYAIRYNANLVTAYARNSVTGTLTQVQNNVTTGVNPYALSVDRSGKYLYVANAGGNSISAYAINTLTGALSAIATVSTPSGAQPLALTASPNKDLLYVTLMSGFVYAYAINPSNGTIVAAQPQSTDGEPIDMLVSAQGNMAFVINATSGSINSFKVNSSTGYLSTGDTALSVSNDPNARPVAGALTSDGSRLYVVNQNSLSLSVFDVDLVNGALTPVSAPAGKPVASTQRYPTSIALNAAQDRLYVTNTQDNTLSVYVIDTVTGWPELIDVYATGNGPGSVKVVR